jgi:oxygen-dependent protoporphyrinogen oxidase
MNQPVLAIGRNGTRWTVTTASGREQFDSVVLATPAHVTGPLLMPVDPALGHLHDIPASSAILVALLYSESIPLPEAFGFLVQQPQQGFHPALLAGTFSQKKYPHTVPSPGMSLRAFFGGKEVAIVESMEDDAIADLAQQQLRILFPKLPGAEQVFVQRWPRSLPQYELGHEERVRQIEERAIALPGLYLLGNAYYGVGLPDMVQRARRQARSIATPAT